MSYDSINDESKKHLLKLIEFLYDEVSNSGGDGDAIWYSRFYDIKQLLPIVEEFNKIFWV